MLSTRYFTNASCLQAPSKVEQLSTGPLGAQPSQSSGCFRSSLLGGLKRPCRFIPMQMPTVIPGYNSAAEQMGLPKKLAGLTRALLREL